MIELNVTDSRLIAVAIGHDGGFLQDWFVQTTDILPDTQYSEVIEEQLSCKEHALAIARLYADKYGLKIIDWSEV